MFIFAPTGRVPAREDREKLLNRIAGKAYVDAEGFYIRRIEGRLPGGTEVDLSGFKTVKKFELTFQQEEFEGLIVNSRTEILLVVDTIFGTKNRREVDTYRNFRYRPQPTPQP